MRALLLTTDPLLVNTFTNVSQQLGIEAQATSDFGTISHQLSSSKYEALVLDFDTAAGLPVLESVWRHRTHHSAVVFAVTSDADLRDRVLQSGAHFILRRPIESAQIRRTLDAAYDFMLGERRRYFRCVAQLPARLTVGRLGSTLECTTINISNDGMTVHAPVSLSVAEIVSVGLTLPGGFVVSATGIVVWDDKHGRCGLRLQCKGQEHRRELDRWLNSQFNPKRN
jgi:DNA-binding response OmpR family regulator